MKKLLILAVSAVFFIMSGLLYFLDSKIHFGLPFCIAVAILVFASVQQAKVLPTEKKTPLPKSVKKALGVQTVWGDQITQEDTSGEEEVPRSFFYTAPYIYAIGGGGLSALWLVGMHFIPTAMPLITAIVGAFAIIIFFACGLPLFMLYQEKRRG